jgi:hypothetical protein
VYYKLREDAYRTSLKKERRSAVHQQERHDIVERAAMTVQEFLEDHSGQSPATGGYKGHERQKEDYRRQNRGALIVWKYKG